MLSIEDVKQILMDWAQKHTHIHKLYLYGSYVTKNHTAPSDIDVAIEISYEENDIPLSFWCAEAKKLQEELEHILNYKIHLEWFDAKETPIVKQGLDKGHLLIYEKSA